MSKLSDAFKKIWRGIQVAEPYLSVAGHLAPPPFGTILIALDALINTAEAKFPAAGSGVAKAEFFSEKGLQVAEILSGKNVNNPKTRAIVAQIGVITVQIKDFEAQLVGFKDQYQELARDLKEAIDSAKE